MPKRDAHVGRGRHDDALLVVGFSSAAPEGLFANLHNPSRESFVAL
jgi:hypothetical protein